jgi:HSP20 family protein
VEDAMDRMLGSFFRPSRVMRQWSDEWHIPMDIYQTEDAVVLKASVPGIAPEELDITVEGNALTLSGEVKGDEGVDAQDYFLQERRYGTFQRSITLPTGLETDKVEASHKNGILTLRIPKREEVRPKSIKINVQ